MSKPTEWEASADTQQYCVTPQSLGCDSGVKSTNGNFLQPRPKKRFQVVYNEMYNVELYKLLLIQKLILLLVLVLKSLTMTVK